VDVVIRPARADEIAVLGDVERDGDRRYAGYDGVPPGFDDAVAPSALEAAAAEGRLWVAAAREEAAAPAGTSHDGALIGFALAESLDGRAHLAQLSVRLRFQGHGVGRRLVETVCQWAREGSMTAVTLCTFSDVDWNRPLYEHLGFAVLSEERWTPELRAVFESDGALGLDLGRRVVMCLDLPGGS
jgi:GNAT superfamily N-acetyltransferase